MSTISEALDFVANWQSLEQEDENATYDAVYASGSWMLEELRRSPNVKIGQSVVNFFEDKWSIPEEQGLAERNALTITFKENCHKNRIKLHCLILLVKCRNEKPASVLALIKALGKLLDDLSFPAFSSPSLTVVKKYYECDRTDVQASTRNFERKILARYLRFLQAYFDIAVDREVFAYLEVIERNLQSLETEEHKLQVVPADYLNKLLVMCDRLIDDPHCPIPMRITAAMTLIYSQVGMRTRELALMTVDALKFDTPEEGSIPPLAYFEFRSPKSAPPGHDYKLCRCTANETSLKAYYFLLDHCKEYREKLGVDTLVVFPRQVLQYTNASTIKTNFYAMILSMRDELPCTNSQDLYPELKTTEFFSNYLLKKYEAYSSPETRIDEETTFVYPVIHQFRVTVCTALYEAGVDLEYIRQHMSHLADDMTAYYIRSDDTVNEQYSQVVYDCILNDGSKLMGKGANEFVAKVDAFIKAESANVTMTNDEIARKAAKYFPLVMKIGGLCTMCGQYKPCPEKTPTDELLCAFRLCPNLCHMYFTAAETYDFFREYAEVIAINEKRNLRRETEKEIRKLQNIIKDSLIPELEELELELARQGRETVIKRFPALQEVADNLSSIKKEAESWLTR